MNFLEAYYNITDQGQISVSAEQGSEFAKRVANDFNPIHDRDAKRFCVPGDLLFAIALNQYGLYQHMTFKFLDLVAADVVLDYPSSQSDSNAEESGVDLVVHNHRQKPVLALEANGSVTRDATQIEQVLRKYVAFSGHNFPHILVPLMEQHGVMINPNRPLVIYESMAFHLDTIDFTNIEIELGDTRLEVAGKRGDAILSFVISNEGQEIGHGEKKLVLSGLREYEHEAIEAMRADYLQRKSQ